MKQLYTLMMAVMISMTSFAQTQVDVTISPASGDISAALNAELKQGQTPKNITINLVENGSYTLSTPISPAASVIINGAQGAVIDASNLTSLPSGKKSDEEKGTNSFIVMSNSPATSQTNGYYRVNEVTIKNVTIKGLKNALFSDQEVKYCITDCGLSGLNPCMSGDNPRLRRNAPYAASDKRYILPVNAFSLSSR